MKSLAGRPALVRAIGRWTLTALVLNSIIGSGIFGLPGAIAKHLGSAAPLSYLLAALLIGVIVAVFAEVSSQFSESGGQYLYAREALGRFVGVQVGWFFLFARLTSAAAVVNLFVNYLAEFWPAATGTYTRVAVIIALVGGLAIVNYRGVRAGATLSNFFTITKISALGLFIIAGLIFAKPAAAAVPATAPDFTAWTEALLALVFAFGGFESGLLPAAEARNPRRDAPFALGLGLAIVALIYFLVHLVTMWSVPDLAQSTRPLADAARAWGGSWGAGAMAVAALLSTYGWAAGAFVTIPRLMFAMGERGDFPRVLATIHPRFRSPHVAIVGWTLLALALAIYGSFIWNAVLAGVARLVTWAVTCVVLLQLRRKNPTADRWRAPAGPLLAFIGIAFCVVLTRTMTAAHFLIMGVVGMLATLNWFVVRERKPAGSTST